MCRSLYPICSFSLENPDQPSGRVWLPVYQVWGAQFQQRLGAPCTPNTRALDFQGPWGFGQCDLSCGLEPFSCFSSTNPDSYVMPEKGEHK